MLNVLHAFFILEKLKMATVGNSVEGGGYEMYLNPHTISERKVIPYSL